MARDCFRVVRMSFAPPTITLSIVYYHALFAALMFIFAIILQDLLFASFC